MSSHTHPLYWNYSDDPLLQLALSMIPYEGSDIPSYRYITSIIDDNDPITILVIMYTMLRLDDRDAYFYAQDGTLYLYTNTGFDGVDIDIDIDGDVVTDANMMFPSYVPDRDRLIYITNTIMHYLPHTYNNI